MTRRAELVEILKTEYGIGSKAELEKAIAKLGGLDISLFCAEIKNTRSDSNEKKDGKSKKILVGSSLVFCGADGVGNNLRPANSDGR